MKGIEMTSPALVVGDTLVMDDGRELTITRLVPATGGEAIARGEREVFSLSWSVTLERDDVVRVLPRHGVLYRPAVAAPEVTA